jgi:hypothetical protein
MGTGRGWGHRNLPLWIFLKGIKIEERKKPNNSTKN